MKDNTYTTEPRNSSTFVTIAKTAGVLGLAYLAYQKRDKINEGYIAAKDSTKKMVEPLAQGLKDTTGKVQSFVKSKTQDATDAVTSLSSQMEDKMNNLTGEAKTAYSTQLRSLSDKINSLTEKAEKSASDTADKLDDKADKLDTQFDSHMNHKLEGKSITH